MVSTPQRSEFEKIQESQEKYLSWNFKKVSQIRHLSWNFKKEFLFSLLNEWKRIQNAWKMPKISDIADKPCSC